MAHKLGPSFKQRVLRAVARIPRGETRSYAQIAKSAGNPKAARAVGAILRANHDPNVPCHRVVKRDGTIGGYNKGVREKQRRLEEETVIPHS